MIENEYQMKSDKENMIVKRRESKKTIHKQRIQ